MRLNQLIRAGRFKDAELGAIALADKDDCHAFVLLGAIYEGGGNGVDKNLDLALQNYSKSVEMCGAVEGCLGVARILYQRATDPTDLARAFCLYKQVADVAGHDVALIMLGKMHFLGEGTEQDLEKAETYVLLALKAGNVHAFDLMSKIKREQGNAWLAFKWRVRGLIERTFFVGKYRARQI